MKQQGKFILLSLAEFAEWLKQKQVTRRICLIQNHHTWKPNYQTFNGHNHFEELFSMEKDHIERDFAEIAQNLTIFPDGLIAICRDMDKAPAGIYGANSNGICIENIGNFDAGYDQITEAHREAIVKVNALLCLKFDLPVDIDHVVYHAWYNLDTGARDNLDGKKVDKQHKTCPGTGWFGGNSVQSARANFIPLVQKEMV